jgi:predicted glutamine amidotransferase
MCRLLGWVARPGVSLREVLGENSFGAFAQLSRIHADGWGLAAVRGDRVEVRRSTTAAGTDPAFQQAATEVVTEGGLAHLRWASPGLPVELCNAHPFQYGSAAFAHNGGIYPLHRVGELLTGEWRSRLTGATDSEHYFLAIMAEVHDHGCDVPTAIRQVTARLAAQYQPSSLNALLLTPEALYAVNCHDASLKPVLPALEPVPAAGVAVAVEAEAPYYDMRYRRTATSVVVASSGFAQPEGGGWTLLPNNSVLVAERGSSVTRVVPLDVELTPTATVSDQLR